MTDTSPPSDLGLSYWRTDVRLDRALDDLSSGAIDEGEFRLLADYLPTLCWLADGKGYIRWYNRRWHDYCGTTPDQMEGWGWTAVHDPDRLPSVVERWRESIATGEPFEMTFPLRGGDGVFRPFLTRIVPLRDASGRVARWFGVNSEVSDLVAAERASSESEARLRRVLDGMGEGFALLDRDFRILDVNAEALRLEQRERGALIGRTHWEAYPGSEDSEIGRLYKRAMGERTPVSLEHRFEWADGHQAWLGMRAFPVEEGLAVFYRDITESRDATAERDNALSLLRNFAEAVPGVVYAKDRDGRMLVANRGTTALIGRPPEEYVGRTDAEFLDDPAQADAVMANDARIMASGESEQIEEEVSFPDGGRAVWLSTKAPMRDEAGEVVGLIGSSVDITQRKAAEAALAESERRFRFALDAAGGIGTWDWDVAADKVHAGQRFAEMYGVDADRAAAGLPVDEFVAGIHPDDRERVAGEIERAMANGSDFRSEYRLVGRDGQVHWVIARGRCLLDEAGRPARFPGVTFDITDRKRAEDALREKEALLDAVIDAMPVGVIVADATGRIVRDNDANREIWGVPPETPDVDGYGDWEGYRPDTGQRIQAHEWGMARALLTGETVRDELVENVRFDTGEHRFFLNSAAPVRDREGRIVGGVVAALDMTERLAVERALRETEERYRLAARATNDAIWDWRMADGLVVWNPALTQLFGHEALETDADWWIDHIHPDDRARVDREIHAVIDGDGPGWTAEYRFRRADGSYADVLDRGTVLRDGEGRAQRMIGAMLDLTERRRAEESLRELNERLEQRVAEEVAERAKAEEALRQSQKMEAVGQLTGGIAHDFNNLLTVVTGNIDMTGRALEAAGVSDPRARRALDAAMKGAERAAALTQRLLAFSRRQPLAPKPMDADRLVAGMSDLLNRALGETIKLEIVTSPGLWKVEADPNQLENAILNLAVNARDAMPDGGVLTVETANARLDEEYAAAHAEVAPGQYVVIAVTDTGQGMNKDTLGRVFEPFFTTKEVGKGTGLGLSQVYGFTKQSGGHVKIYSEEGQGTTVKIYLPRLVSAEGEEPGSGDLTQGLEVSRKRETVLAVEDDDDVRAYTVECLRELGYRVLEAHDGPSAIRLVERQADPIDLLFTDVVMPGMSGSELAEELRKRQPNLRVLFTSGYTRNAIVHGGRLDEGVEMIAKPFTYQALAAKVRDMLEAGRTRRVLVVEDEPTVRAFAVEALAGAGYAAEEAATAAEALMKVRAAQGRYDAVILDSGLPDKPGEAVLAELRSRHLDMPVLLASGEHADELGARFADDRCTGVLPKPFTGAKLSQALKDLGLRCAKAG